MPIVSAPRRKPGKRAARPKVREPRREPITKLTRSGPKSGFDQLAGRPSRSYMNCLPFTRSPAMHPMTRSRAPLLLSLLVVAAACTIRVIQPAAAPAPGGGPKPDSAKKDLPWKPFAEVTKDARVSTGLFTAYLKRENAYLALKPEQLDHDYLMVTELSQGIGELGIDGGSDVRSDLVRFHRSGDHVELWVVHPYATATPNTPMARTVAYSFGHSVAQSFPIASIRDTTNEVLVDLVPFLVSDWVDHEERDEIDEHFVRGIADAGDRERLGHRVPERVGDGARHRRVRRRGGVGVHDPQLDVVAAPVEPDQVGAHVTAAVNAQLADPLRQLRDHEIVVVELLGLERQVSVFPLEIGGEQPGRYAGILGHLGEGLPGEVLLGAVGLGAAARRRSRRRLDDANGAGGGHHQERQEKGSARTGHGMHRGTPGEGQTVHIAAGRASGKLIEA